MIRSILHVVGSGRAVLALGAFLLIAGQALAECDPHGSQPQDDCYPLGETTTVQAQDQINVGVDEVANACLTSNALCAQSVEQWQEWFRRALVALNTAKAKCGKKCKGVHVEGL